MSNRTHTLRKTTPFYVKVYPLAKELHIHVAHAPELRPRESTYTLCGRGTQAFRADDLDLEKATVCPKCTKILAEHER